MRNKDCKVFLSPAEKTGFTALLLALLLGWFNPVLAPLPLLFFLLLCLGMPFLPDVGFFLPLVSRGTRKTEGIALTFDDGPSPASTPILLDLLARHHLPATFFVVGEKARRHPELIAAILAQGHTIGNHSWRHDYFLMLRTPKVLRADIRQTQDILAKSGVTPLVFRPPVGITGPRLGKALARENLIAVNYSCRAFDGGNRNIGNLAEKLLRRLQPGDIIMLHDLPPRQKSLSGYWQQELDRLFSALNENYQVAPLEEIIEYPVMRKSGKSPALGNGT
ncbi:MAG: polysaccharide deacetylase family protein [Deltaproteobacteria bacterium]|nr:polysaccharide deacetylase family protein [Deltaproteobacteria bacterium]